MWCKNREAPSRYQLIIAVILILCVPAVLFPQAREAQTDELQDTSQPQIQAKTVLVVPIVPQGAPRYTGMLMTKLVEQNFARTEALSPSVLAQDLVTTTRVGELAEELDSQERDFRLIELGTQQGVRYVAAGAISKDGSNYNFRMIIVDVQQERRVLSSEKTAVGLENVDRIVRAFTDELITAEFPETVQERVQQIRAAEADGDEDLREDLADLEQIAEKDPEEAIRRLPEKVQKAVAAKAKEQAKDEAREEVVQEEIQILYDKEKEDRRIARARKIQKYAMLSGYGFQFMANTLSDAAIQSNMRALKSWSLYMNDVFWMDPYEEYKNFHSSSNGLNIGGYVMNGLGTSALSYSYINLRDDVLQVRKGSRVLLVISNNLYLAGRAASFISGGIGYYSMDRYNSYIGEHDSTDEISTKYDEYRDIHFIYDISRYTAISLQAVGAMGIAVSYFWPGEREQLVLSGKAGFQLGLSNIFSGAGTVLSQVALNLYSQGIESSISANSPSGNPEADPYAMYNTYALTAGLGALALYTTSAVLSTRAITERNTKDEKVTNHRGSPPFSVAVAPTTRGITVAFEVKR